MVLAALPGVALCPLSWSISSRVAEAWSWLSVPHLTAICMDLMVGGRLVLRCGARCAGSPEAEQGSSVGVSGRRGPTRRSKALATHLQLDRHSLGTAAAC